MLNMACKYPSVDFVGLLNQHREYLTAAMSRNELSLQDTIVLLSSIGQRGSAARVDSVKVFEAPTLGLFKELAEYMVNKDSILNCNYLQLATLIWVYGCVPNTYEEFPIVWE